MPGISEYQEELTDLIFGSMIIHGRMAKSADNIYVRGNAEKLCREYIRSLLQDVDLTDESTSSKDNLGDRGNIDNGMDPCQLTNYIH